jgi:hypothetical protein
MLEKLSAVDPFRSEACDAEKLSRFNIKMKKTEGLLAQSNVDLLKAVTAVYSCFVDFLRRGPVDTVSYVNTYPNDNKQQLLPSTTFATNDSHEKKSLFDELMRTAADDVVLGLLEKDVDYEDYYSEPVLIKLLYLDRDKLDDCSKVTYDVINSVTDHYEIDMKQLINHIRERNREIPAKESDLAISIRNFVDSHDAQSTFSDFLDWSQKKTLQFTDGEKITYSRLFESHIKKMVDAKQELLSQVSIDSFFASVN